MKQLSVAVLGCGNRGHYYTHLLLQSPDRYTISSYCDIDPAQLQNMKDLYGLDVPTFCSEEEFFQEKRGDVLILATPDRDHVRQAVRAMKLGYHLLLEKPVSDSREEIELLLKTQKETGRSVMVCHVLRFGAGYRKCKELLDEGAIGRLYAIDASERVVYWHWAQAYVRGVGALEATGHPTILAKCSHDLDLMQFYAASPCDTVSSLGGLDFFTPENAPEGAAKRCVDCKHMNTCPYSAKRMYVDMWHEKGEPEYMWPFFRACNTVPTTEEGLYEGLRTGPYGRCAFFCPVDHADHQFVQMQFQNGVRASLKMVYAAKSGRRITFYGTLGEMIFDEREDTVTLMPFGKEATVYPVRAMIEGGHRHGGGDSGLIRELYDMISGRLDAITGLEKSVECHLMGIAAEESRKAGGALTKVHR